MNKKILLKKIAENMLLVLGMFISLISIFIGAEIGRRIIIYFQFKGL